MVDLHASHSEPPVERTSSSDRLDSHPCGRLIAPSRVNRVATKKLGHGSPVLGNTQTITPRQERATGTRDPGISGVGRDRAATESANGSTPV